MINFIQGRRRLLTKNSLFDLVQHRVKQKVKQVNEVKARKQYQ